MCHWQRWPHYAALLPALIGVVSSNFTIKRLMIVLVALLVATSGAIGVFHAGVEYGFWPGLTACTAAPGGTLADIMNAPITRCDTPAWTMFGVSMAGYNSLISLSGALLLLGLAPRSR
jgi:disulfide bond formation protein DsbB